MQVASARAGKHMSRLTARVAWLADVLVCVLPILQSRGLGWRRTTTSHAACTPFISQAFCDGRMSTRKHMVISPRPSNHPPIQPTRAATANPPARACCSVTSLLLRVWRRTGQPHSVVRGIHPSTHGLRARGLSIVVCRLPSNGEWRACCKPSPLSCPAADRVGRGRLDEMR